MQRVPCDLPPFPHSTRSLNNNVSRSFPSTLASCQHPAFQIWTLERRSKTTRQPLSSTEQARRISMSRCWQLQSDVMLRMGCPGTYMLMTSESVWHGVARCRRLPRLPPPSWSSILINAAKPKLRHTTTPLKHLCPDDHACTIDNANSENLC